MLSFKIRYVEHAFFFFLHTLILTDESEQISMHQMFLNWNFKHILFTTAVYKCFVLKTDTFICHLLTQTHQFHLKTRYSMMMKSEIMVMLKQCFYCYKIWHHSFKIVHSFINLQQALYHSWSGSYGMWSVSLENWTWGRITPWMRCPIAGHHTQTSTHSLTMSGNL